MIQPTASVTTLAYTVATYSTRARATENNVSIGSDSDILNHCPKRLLLGVKQTSNVRFLGPIITDIGDFCFRVKTGHSAGDGRVWFAWPRAAPPPYGLGGWRGAELPHSAYTASAKRAHAEKKKMTLRGPPNNASPSNSNSNITERKTTDRTIFRAFIVRNPTCSITDIARNRRPWRAGVSNLGGFPTPRSRAAPPPFTLFRGAAGARNKERLETAGAAPEALSYQDIEKFETYRCRRIGGKRSGRLLAGSLRFTREAVKQLSSTTKSASYVQGRA